MAMETVLKTVQNAINVTYLRNVSSVIQAKIWPKNISYDSSVVIDKSIKNSFRTDGIWESGNYILLQLCFILFVQFKFLKLRMSGLTLFVGRCLERDFVVDSLLVKNSVKRGFVP
jgi:hypothetical protein